MVKTRTQTHTQIVSRTGLSVYGSEVPAAGTHVARGGRGVGAEAGAIGETARREHRRWRTRGGL